LWGETGTRVWRIAAWERVGERLVFEAARRMGAVRARVEMIPRASAGVASAAVEAARRAVCQQIAALTCSQQAGGAKIESAKLSRGARRGEPGRYARIVLKTARGRVAVSAPVVGLRAHEVDDFLSSTLMWHARLEGKRRDALPVRLRFVVARDVAEATVERLALLRESLRRLASVEEIDDAHTTLTPVPLLELDALLSAAPRFSRPPESDLSRAAREIISLAPEAIDVVRARHGETLRFRGLAFARVRRLMAREQVWFGVRSASSKESFGRSAAGVRASSMISTASTTTGATARRHLLDDDASREQFFQLVQELREHRRADADNKQHAFYRAAPEAWLESLLRRDITRLDPGLRLAPLHAQFRAGVLGRSGAGRPVDLLALRRDGRLVVIELKVSEDAALPLQGADYWRRISTYHRAGHIKRARLFGDAEISDEPPLVYLVAPMLSFHRSFQTLARCITPEIEIYRYDLNEDWRAGVRVMRRERIG
jgi:hypothetical protein